jgi:pyoverdine/dityrosine biosynthesis protein Dit1
MAVYFKIRMQYKWTHDGHILEITGSDLAKPLLERGIAVKRGPAPSRVFREQDLIFASTEFPTDEDRCIRLCEASSAGSNFVRGILMIIEGESAHLKNYHTLLADKADSRRRLNAFPRESQLPKQRGSQKPNMFVKNKMKHAFCEEQARYLQCDRQLLSLAAGTPGIEVVSSHSRGVSLTEGRSSDLPDWWASATHFDEDEHFALIFLSSKHATAEPNNIPNSPSPFTDRIVKLFEDNLLSRHPTEDCWEETGSAHFRTTLEYFVEGELPIQFCLPAFPCKSTNPRKTYCADPDGAEYEAFSHLHQFCLKLREIYAPGADFTVVSDGHVFSDCIGVDDREVYKYTDSVKKLSDIIFSELSPDPGTSPIRFVNLRDIFYGSNGVGSLRPFKIFGQKECIVRRPVETIIDPKDETCRRLMLQSCGFDTGMLEKAIKDDEGHSLTKVYRGFSRFMRDVSLLQAPGSLSLMTFGPGS